MTKGVEQNSTFVLVLLRILKKQFTKILLFYKINNKNTEIISTLTNKHPKAKTQ